MRQKGQSKYFDIDSVKDEINNGKIDAKTVEFKYDDKPYNIMKLGYTIDDNFFYDFLEPNIKINLSNGKVSYMCDLPGCAHSFNSPGCVAYTDFYSPIASVDGVYYVNDNKLLLYNDGNETEILTNKYYTDFETKNYPDNKNVISSIVMHDREFYIICPSYYFTYNLDTKEISEMKSLGDSLCYAFSVSDEYVYHANQNLEMFIQDKKSGKNKKLSDKVGQLCFYNDKLYYIKYENEVPVLYSADKNGENPVKLIEDCYVNYCLTDSCIYYQNYKKGNDVYKCDLDGKNAQKVIFNNLPEGYSLPLVNITFCEAVDHVFFIDEEGVDNKGFLFSVKKGEVNTNTTTIEKDF